MPVAEVDLGGALGDVVVSGPEDSGFSKVHAPAHLILTTTIKVRYCGRGTCFREKTVHLSYRASLTQVIYHPLSRHTRSRRAGCISNPRSMSRGTCGNTSAQYGWSRQLSKRFVRRLASPSWWLSLTWTNATCVYFLVTHSAHTRRY